MKNRVKWVWGAVAVAGLMLGEVQADEQARIAALEQQIEQLGSQIADLKGGQYDLAAATTPASKLSLGGYGEIHANFQDKNKDEDMFDIHRLVMYAGYAFNDWIRLTSETELEHAFVKSGNGEISVEQLYVDFLLSDAFNVRAGRVLAPLGIINKNHEPPLFNGVERPNVEKYIIPSTWSLDGIGVFGSPAGWLSYEAYVVAGLDGSKFNDEEGIRKGRLKERGGLQNLAVSGRVDLYPTDKADLRIGLSGYLGGTNNENRGGQNGTDNTFSMVSADFEYDVSRFKFRGVVAQGSNSDAEDLASGVGEEIFGWYLESGVSVMPASWKSGKLAQADIVPFVRYEEYDTQAKLPSGSADGTYERQEVTLGVNFELTPQFVVKADYQRAETAASGSDPVHKYNLGIGWVFN